MKENFTKGKRRITLWLDRFPWLWIDLVVHHSTLPPWALSVLLFFILLIIGSGISLLAGEPVQFLVDLRRIIIYSLPAFASYTITRVHNNFDKLETNLKPWIANTDEETIAFWNQAPNLLMRGFWIFTLLWLIIVPSLYLIMQHTIGQSPPPPDGGTGMAPEAGHPKTMADVALILTPIVAYFMGAATCIASVGLSTFAHHLISDLDLNEGFVLKGAKAVLDPLIHLLWITWVTIGLPLIMIGMVAVTLGRITDARIPLNPMDIIPVALVIIILVMSVVVPQIFINRFLRKEKQEALDDIHIQIEDAVRIDEGYTQTEILKNMHRFQSLIYLEKKVEKFKPSMIDAAFMLQMAAVISTVLGAFFAVRTFLNLFVST